MAGEALASKMTKDVLSQIEDLQMAIENFAARDTTTAEAAVAAAAPAATDVDSDSDDGHAGGGAGVDASEKKQDSKTLLLCQPDEKTMVEEDTFADKTLVESLTSSPAATAGTTLDQVNIRFSNDFSSLVDHFSALRERLNSEKLAQAAVAAAVAAKNDDEKILDPDSVGRDDDNDMHRASVQGLIDERKHKEEAPGHGSADLDPQDKLQVEEEEDNNSSGHTSQPAILVLSGGSTPLSMRPSSGSRQLSSMPTSPLSASVATPRSRMSATSRRSRRPSTLSKKSSKSSRYFTKHKKEHGAVEYTARSYDEMMRIPDPRERLAFYEKTFKQCMRADSKLGAWVRRTKDKGVPTPMTEGYEPPPRPRTPPQEGAQSRSTLHDGSATPSLSSSISMFLRKASASSTLGRRAFGENTPRPSMSRMFLPSSISRLSLSKSTRQPKVAPDPPLAQPVHLDNKPKHPPTMPNVAAQKPPRPAFTTSSTTNSNSMASRWRSTTGALSKKSKKKRSSESMSCTTASSISPARSISSTFSRFSRSSRRPSIASINRTIPTPQHQPPRPLSPSTDSVVTEMCNTLPHMDRDVIEEYLAEAGGDQMVAITLAMSQLKRTAPHPVYH